MTLHPNQEDIFLPQRGAAVLGSRAAATCGVEGPGAASFLVWEGAEAPCASLPAASAEPREYWCFCIFYS